MKKTSLLFSVATIFGYIITTSSSGGVGRINSVLANGTPGTISSSCNSCHSGGSGTTSIASVTFTDEANNQLISNGQYVPGHSYKVVVNATNTSSLPFYGFQVTMTDAANSNAGTFATTQANTGLINAEGHAIVEHTSAISAPVAGIYMPTFRWIAPAAGKGTVKVYAIVNAVNNDGGSGGDRPSASFQLLLAEGSTTGIDNISAIHLIVYPNPALNTLQVKLPSVSSGKLVVHDITGKIVFAQEQTGAKEMSIPVTQWARGVYHIRYTAEGLNYAAGFLKQ